MAKTKIRVGQEIFYRIKNNNGTLNVQLKKWWGWSTTKSHGKTLEFKCESDVDYWVKLKHPYSYPMKIK